MHVKDKVEMFNENSFQEYSDLIETVAKIEYSRLSNNHFVDFSELINIGSFTVFTILKSQKKTEYNISYMTTAIKWAIRNELRRRYRWYSQKNTSVNSEFNEQQAEEIREALYKTILSIDELETEESQSRQISDSSARPDENAELKELRSHIEEAMNKLSPREKKIIEDRFFGDKKLKDLADEHKISISRLSRIIQSALDKIKEELQSNNFI